MQVKFRCDMAQGTVVDLSESDYRDAMRDTRKLTPDQQLVLAKQIDAACGTELCEATVRKQQRKLRDQLRNQVRSSISETARKSALLESLEEA